MLAALLATLWGGYFSGLFLLLLWMRLVNRTPGVPARWLDSLLVLGLAWSRPNAPWIAAAAFLLDATMEKGLKRHLVFGVLALVSMAQGDSFVGAGVSRQLSWGLLLCLSFLSVCLSVKSLRSRGDADGGELDSHRVVVAHLEGRQLDLALCRQGCQRSP